MTVAAIDWNISAGTNVLSFPEKLTALRTCINIINDFLNLKQCSMLATYSYLIIV